jgi:hypothetical protein
MSNDGTRDVLAKLQQEFSRLKVIDNPQKVTPIALNLGLKASTAAIRAILGAHATIDTRFVELCVSTLNEHPEVGCAGGLIRNTYYNATSEAIGKSMASSFGVGNAHFRTGNADGYVDTVAFGAYRAEVFENIGYFNEALVRNQDDEFNFRLLKHGYKIWLNPAILSDYIVRASYQKLLRQYYQYGYWKVYVNQIHRTITTVRQLIPAMWVGYCVMAILLCALLPSWWLLWLNPAVMYFSLALLLAFKTDRKQGFGIFKAFMCLHFGYGYGYLKGIVHFPILQKKPNRSSMAVTR